MKRLAHAEAQLALAETAQGDIDPGVINAAVSSAVLAGIAAADAATCAALGESSRGESHAEAAKLLERIVPGGVDAAKTFGRLESMKTRAQYGFDNLPLSEPAIAVRRAQDLINFAKEVLAR